MKTRTKKNGLLSGILLAAACKPGFALAERPLPAMSAVSDLAGGVFSSETVYDGSRASRGLPSSGSEHLSMPLKAFQLSAPRAAESSHLVPAADGRRRGDPGRGALLAEFLPKILIPVVFGLAFGLLGLLVGPATLLAGAVMLLVGTLVGVALVVAD